MHELVMVYGLIERASDEPDAMADVSDYHAAGAAVCEPCGQPVSGSAGAAGGAGYGRHPMEAYGANRGVIRAREEPWEEHGLGRSSSRRD